MKLGDGILQRRVNHPLNGAVGRKCGLDLLGTHPLCSSKFFRRGAAFGLRLAQFVWVVGKKAHGTCAIGPITAKFGAILAGVQIHFEYTMGIGACLPHHARAGLVVGTCHSHILEAAWVAAACVFARVGIGACVPAVVVVVGAWDHLVYVHAEFVACL